MAINPFNYYSLIAAIIFTIIQKGCTTEIIKKRINNKIIVACCIDCFKCVSNNGANRACDDPFHNNVSTAILESPCMGGRKGRDGLFPATSCIKIAGYFGM